MRRMPLFHRYSHIVLILNGFSIDWYDILQHQQIWVYHLVHCTSWLHNMAPSPFVRQIQYFHVSKRIQYLSHKKGQIVVSRCIVFDSFKYDTHIVQVWCILCGKNGNNFTIYTGSPSTMQHWYQMLPMPIHINSIQGAHTWMSWIRSEFALTPKVRC